MGLDLILSRAESARNWLWFDILAVVRLVEHAEALFPFDNIAICVEK